jgi:hypothetical protein
VIVFDLLRSVAARAHAAQECLIGGEPANGRETAAAIGGSPVPGLVSMLRSAAAVPRDRVASMLMMPHDG